MLVIDQPVLIAKAGSEGVLVKLNQLRTKYALLARTRQVTKPVSDKTGLPEGLIAGAVNVQLPGPSLLLIVEAKSLQPGTARVIADAAAQELITLVANEMKAQKITDDFKIVLTLVSPAQPGGKILPTRDRAMSVGGLVGVLAFVGTIALFETVGAIRRRR